MQTRRLGSSELDLPVVTFGAWAIGGWQWGGTDDELARRAVRRAIDVGMSAIDTAPVYGFGHSESVVGEAIRGRRDEVLILTKAGLRWDSTDGRLGYRGKDLNGDPIDIYLNSRPESLRFEVEQSLSRLGIERIDLLQIHRADPTTPIAESMGVLVELRSEGKLREIGVSNYSVEQMDEARAALGDVPLVSAQPRYSLVRREIESDVLPYAREHGVGLLAYSPIEQGLLAGAVPEERTFARGDGRRNRPTFRAGNRAEVNALLEEVARPIADAHGATLAQVAIAWVIGTEGITAALVGARNPEQVAENAAAAELELAPDAWARLGRAFAELDLDLAP